MQQGDENQTNCCKCQCLILPFNKIFIAKVCQLYDQQDFLPSPNSWKYFKGCLISLFFLSITRFDKILFRHFRHSGLLRWRPYWGKIVWIIFGWKCKVIRSICRSFGQKPGRDDLNQGYSIGGHEATQKDERLSAGEGQVLGVEQQGRENDRAASLRRATAAVHRNFGWAVRRLYQNHP